MNLIKIQFTCPFCSKDKITLADKQKIINYQEKGLLIQDVFSPITCVYYADPANGSALVNDALVTIEGNEYYFDKECKLALASATADEYENNEGKWSYYVNKDGSVAKNGLFKVAGINRLFRENGKIVSYADEDVKEGKITVDGISYVIDKTTSEAKKEFTWTKESVDWTVKYSDTAGENGTAKAVFHLKSDAEENNTVDVTATPDKISITVSDDDKKTFKATITYNGQDFEDEMTVRKGIDLIDGKHYVTDADGKVLTGYGHTVSKRRGRASHRSAPPFPGRPCRSGGWPSAGRPADNRARCRRRRPSRKRRSARH